MEHKSVDKMLKMIGYMIGNRSYSVKQLELRLGLSERSVYRYFDTLRNNDFKLVKESPGVYSISEMGEGFLACSDIMTMTGEEARYLWTLLLTSSDDSLERRNLIRKVSMIVLNQ